MSLTHAAERPEFLPPPETGRGPALGLALLAHLLLVGALAWGVAWKRDDAVLSAEAELWAATPQQAAPRAEEAPPPPPPPPAPVARPAPPPPPAVRDADIAIEKEKKRKQLEAEKERERLQKEKALAEKKAAEKKAAELGGNHFIQLLKEAISE